MVESKTARANQKKPRILVVEDEEAIAQGIVFNLQRKGYEVELTNNGKSALEQSEKFVYDLIVLDILLPELDGFAVCQQLRQNKNFTPILMLTAKSQPDDVIYGLKMGADDYVAKPFDLAEFLARVEVLLRRQQWQNNHLAEPATDRWEFGEFWVDFQTFTARTQNGEIELSKKEVDVLRLFRRRPYQVIRRQELLAEVWGLPEHPNQRVVDNVIVSLRKMFERDPSRPHLIRNVRGVGYRFVPGD